MPNPTLSDVHVNRPLTEMAMNWIQDQEDFLGTSDVLPYIGNESKSDSYFIYDKNDLNRDEAKVRAPGTESAGSGFRLDNSGSFNAEKIAIHQDIPYDTLDNQDNALDLERGAMNTVMQKLMIKQDRDFASAFMGASNWNFSYDLSGSESDLPSDTQWNNDSGSPIKVMKYIMDQDVGATWRPPTIGIIGKNVFSELEFHSNIVDNVKYTNNVAEVDKEDLIANLLGLRGLFVPEANYATANEDTSVSVNAASNYTIKPDDVLLLHVPTNASVMNPSAAYVFGWEGMRGADGLNIRVKRLEDDMREVVRIEGEMAYDMKVTSSYLGAYIANAIS